MCRTKPVREWREWTDVFKSWTIIPGDKLAEFSKRSNADRISHTWTLDNDVQKYGTAAGTPMYLGRFMKLKRLDAHFYLDVVPTKQAIEAVEKNSIFVEYDTMSFEAIEWPCGRTLIVCHNGKIIGGPWITKIDSVTIPAFPLEDS